ncbi:bifunctional diguanylate cyclase/phosphodiesterase [Marinobacterium litorale]|uniref:bifunctional diguanylate cyclase/phosphodiesterase n=1 Tax=Marinobacterium litorale TaxID=404770 RepID=UPI0006861D57|nr:EAL domain-containing protein [Marinobacterium litorale]
MPLVITGAAVVALVLAYFVIRPYLLTLNKDNARYDMQYSLNRLQGTLEYMLSRGDLDGLRREVAANSARRDVKHLLVLDPGFSILAASTLASVGQPLATVPLHHGSDLINRSLTSLSVMVQYVKYENSLYGVAPLRFPDTGQLRPDAYGVIVLELDMGLATAQGLQRIEELFVWVSLGILLLGGLFWYGFDRHIRRRLNRITEGLGALEQGRYEEPVPLAGHDELAQIAQAMNQLAASLQQSRTALEFQHRRFDRIMRHIPALVSIVDSQGTLRFANRRFVEDYGRDPANETITLEQVFSEEVARQHRTWNAQVLESHKALQLEPTYSLRGQMRSWLMVKFPLTDGAADGDSICTVSMDVTEKEQSERLVRISKRIFENTSEGIIVTDAERRIVEVNNSFARITGYDKRALLGRTPDMLRGDEERRHFDQAFWDSVHSNGRWQGEVVNRRADGTLYTARLSVSTITGREGDISGYFAIYQDISAEKRAEESLRELAYYDTLTGLYNRASFKQKVSDALQRLNRFRESFGLLFIDLDRFKEVNDSVGHEEGDKLLGQVARRIEHQLRELDVACRLGGDEFTVLVPHVAADGELAIIAQRVIDTISQPYLIGENELIIGCSVGIVVAPRDGQDADVLMRHADAAMYHAKESGRGRYAFFDADIDARNQRQMRIKQGLRLARARDELSLVYQPEVDPVTGEARLYEALMRWNSQELGPVSPAEFIAVAEDSELIGQLTEWLIDRMARDTADLALEGAKISINLSPRQFRSESWLHLLESAIESGRIDPKKLCIEVTESALVEDFELACAQLAEIKSFGVEVAIDDFGTGYSSLANLKRLPIDYLKIDRSFVADIGQDADDQTIVETVIILAHALGMKVVAEGAETGQQVEFLRGHGCDLIQGYFYSRPLPISELEAFSGDS